jgi:hypothetical protein
MPTCEAASATACCTGAGRLLVVAAAAMLELVSTTAPAITAIRRFILEADVRTAVGSTEAARAASSGGGISVSVAVGSARAARARVAIRSRPAGSGSLVAPESTASICASEKSGSVI